MALGLFKKIFKKTGQISGADQEKRKEENEGKEKSPCCGNCEDNAHKKDNSMNKTGCCCH